MSRLVSLRITLIAVFVLTAIAPLGALALFETTTARAALETMANRLLTSAAQQTATRLDNRLSADFQNILVIAQNVSIITYLNLSSEQRPASVSERAASTVLFSQAARAGAETGFIAFTVLDAQGQAWLSTDLAQINQNQAQTSYFQAARSLERGDRYLSPIIFKNDGAASYYLASPIYNTDLRQVGIVVAEYSATLLQALAMAGNADAGDQAFVAIYDSKLFNVAHGAAPELQFRFVTTTDATPLDTLRALNQIPSRPDGELNLNLTELGQKLQTIATVPVFRAIALPNSERIYEGAAVRSTQQPEWIIVAFQPEDVFLAPINEQTRTIVLFTLGLSGLALGVAYVVSQQIATPLERLTQAAQRLAKGDLTASVDVQAQNEIGQLARAFNAMAIQLEELFTGLEKRVRERTEDLLLAVNLGVSLASQRDLDVVLAETVEAVRQRFNLYYAQVYLLDSSGRFLNMRAGSGEVGLTLRNRGFRLPVSGLSLNSTAVTERRVVVVADVRQALNFRPNPLLPDTRSEACLPLALGERVVGVLDLQSAEVGFFNDNNLPVFQVIAAQLAIAAQNVALLVEAQQARAALETQTRHLARRGWAGFLNAIALPDRLSAQYNAAEHAPPAGDTLTLEFPLTMLGEAIGEIRLEGLAAGSWAAEDQELLQTVAQQVAQQAENLRIVAEAERYRAEAEAASRRLTREAWTAYAKHTLSFAYQNDSVQPLDDLALPEARTALDVTARGEPIGQIILPRATFDAAEAEIATAVTEQLGAHLENLRLIEQTRQRAAQLETLNRLSQTIATQLDLQGLLQLAGESIRDLFQADYTFVALYDSDHNQLTFPYFRGPQGLMDLSPVAVGPGLISYVVNHRQPLLIARNSEQAMRQYGAVLVGSGEHAKTWLGVPVLAGQDVLGVVSVQVMAREEAYDDNDVRLLATIAATLATALQNIRLFDRMRLTSALNERLYQLASRIAAADDLQAVLAALAETFPVPAVNRLVLFIFEYDAQGQISAARIGANWHSGAGALPTPVGTRYPPAVFSAIKSLFGRAPLIVADPAHDARVDLATRGVLQRQNIASLGALPLIVGQRQMGALLLETQTPYDFPDVDLQPYLAVAGTVAVALDNQLLLAEAQTRLRREQILRAVTEQVRGAPDVDAVLRRTAQEVGQALGRRVFVQIKEIAPVAVSSVVTVKG